jgi:hypothetical protein
MNRIAQSDHREYIENTWRCVSNRWLCFILRPWQFAPDGASWRQKHFLFACLLLIIVDPPTLSHDLSLFCELKWLTQVYWNILDENKIITRPIVQHRCRRRCFWPPLSLLFACTIGLYLWYSCESWLMVNWQQISWLSPWSASYLQKNQMQLS